MKFLKNLKKKKLKNKITPILIVGGVILLVVLSIIIGGPDTKKGYLSIKNSSIPDNITVGDVFTIELSTNLHKNNIQFVSSDTSIAAVNNEGLVTVLKSGKVTITVKSVYEEKRPLEDSIKITIKN